VDEDYPARSEIQSVPEWINMAQNCPLWRLMSMFGNMHS